MFWEVLFIILNDQNLLAACSHDVGLCSTQYYILILNLVLHIVTIMF
jgi:hypothetical protein